MTAAQAAGSYSASVTPAYQSDSDLDAGGEVGYAAVFTSLRGNWALDARSTLGLGLSLDFEDWRFNDVPVPEGIEPWDRVVRIGFTLP